MATKFGVPRTPVSQLGDVGSIRAASIPTVQYSTGAAQVLQQFSRDMFAVGNQLHDRLDAQAEEEATREGAMDALGGTVETRDFSTIRGQAYNKANLETFITTMETSSVLKIEALKQQFANDPAGLSRALADYRAGVTQELTNVDPRVAATFDQRFTMRSIPALEQARDNNFAMTRSQADASILQSEVALKAELRGLSADLFSTNPDRSAAASSAIGMVQADLMRVYQAVDPVTGKPLYSPVEQEQARQGFYATVMETASLSWFDQQENKADAYLKFIEDDFTINLATPGADPSLVVMANEGATRNDPLQSALVDQVAIAAASLGPGFTVQVHSGGQEAVGEGGTRTGSERHDHGGAGDMVIYQNGQALDPATHREVYVRFAQSVAAAGATGIGIDLDGGYIHVGGGDKAAWGYGPNGGKAEYLPPDFADAINAGWAGPALSTEATSQPVNIREALPAAVLDKIETDMRQRIAFGNQLASQAATQEEAALKQLQEATSYEMTVALMAPAGTVDPETGQPFVRPTVQTITEAARLGQLDGKDAERLIKAMTVEAPNTSDSVVYQEMLRRMHSGEDIRGYVFENMARLSQSDAQQLLTQNNSLNVAGSGSLSDEQSFYEQRLKDTLEPDGLMAEFDDGAEGRKFLALDEYRQRVLEGENARVVAVELQERAKVDDANVVNSALGSLIRPRYSVPGSKPGQIDAAASALALQSKLAENKISETQYWQQAELLRQWDEIQKRVAQGLE